MNVLIGIATYPTKPHIYPACLASIEALEHSEAFVVAPYGEDDPKLGAQDNLVTKHNLMREHVLTNGYDALLTIEADMIVPPAALTKLAAVMESGVDVVYALYGARSSGMWLCFPEITGGKGISLSAAPDQAKAAWGKVVKSEGAGFGCTLISRRVLEAVEFRRDKRRRFDDDWQFALDVKEAGFASAHHLGVVCGHVIHEGGVLWPDPDAPKLHRIDGQTETQPAAAPLPEMATYRVLKRLSGPSRDYLPGLDTIELKAEDAAILLERRAIELIKES